MRELKFRAWDGINMKPWDKIKEKPLQVFEYSGTQKFMQYTGLKDKNGKEIYEGDIVIAWDRGTKAKCEVRWRQEANPCFILFPAWQSNQMWSISATKHDPGKQFISVSAEITTTDKKGYYDDGLEVIGNIYENPELLKP